MNFANIQSDTIVRVAAVVAILLGFVACLIVMVVEYVTHGANSQLPTVVNTVITSVLTFSVAALSSHQGAQIQQSGAVTGAATVANTTSAAADALEKVGNGAPAKATQATNENTQATQDNTAQMRRQASDTSHG